jgi:ATP-dependent DNA helicase RecG
MLEAKALLTVEDLLAYVPFRYEDRSNTKTIAELAPGEMATVVAQVRSARVAGFRRRNLGLFEASFTDASRAVLRAKWFHGEYLAKTLEPGKRLALFGKVEFDNYTGELAMLHPEFEMLTEDDEDAEAALHVGRVVPVYEAIAKVNTRALRTIIHRALQQIAPLQDPLPGSMDRCPAHALPSSGVRLAPAQCVSVAGAISADLRRVLLAGVRPAGTPGESARASGHRL